MHINKRKRRKRGGKHINKKKSNNYNNTMKAKNTYENQFFWSSDFITSIFTDLDYIDYVYSLLFSEKQTQSKCKKKVKQEFTLKDLECKLIDGRRKSVKVDVKLKIESFDVKLELREPIDSVESFKFELIIHGHVFFEGAMLVCKLFKRKVKIIAIVMEPPKEFQELMKKYGLKFFKKFDKAPIGLLLKEVPEDEEIFTESFLRETLKEVKMFFPSEHISSFDIIRLCVIQKLIPIIIQNKVLLKKVPEEEEIFTESFLRETLKEIEMFLEEIAEDTPSFDIVTGYVIQKAIPKIIQNKVGCKSKGGSNLMRFNSKKARSNSKKSKEV